MQYKHTDLVRNEFVLEEAPQQGLYEDAVLVDAVHDDPKEHTYTWPVPHRIAGDVLALRVQVRDVIENQLDQAGNAVVQRAPLIGGKELK